LNASGDRTEPWCRGDVPRDGRDGSPFGMRLRRFSADHVAEIAETS
jgi:hypothetical protein